MTSYYEKPKGWSEAPRESWVSGTPIGQEGIGMPKLGDPAEHQESSSKVSFGDEGEGSGSPAIYQGKTVGQCPAGTSNDNGVCVPNLKSKASLESKVKAAQRGSRQGGEDVSVGKEQRGADSFKREIEGAPRGGKPHPLTAKLAKKGKGE
jgi:hypothetical protein